MSSNASSSGIESDTDSSPSLNEEKDNRSVSDLNNMNDESTETLVNDNDDEGFVNMNFDRKESIVMMSDIKKQPTEDFSKEQFISQTSKSNYKQSCHYPFSTRNPYDDDSSSSSVVEDWDEECKVVEPYYFPGYIRRAQWPNHWRWTPPLGIRRTCTQQLHHTLGFQPSGLYDDIDSLTLSINLRHLRFDF